MPQIEVSVTDFARFVGATTASSRLKAVRDAKLKYEPAYDFYKGLREAIVRGHVQRTLELTVREAIQRASARRQRAYQEAGAAYLRFAKRKTFDFDRRMRGWKWTEGNLTVRVNPEIVIWLRSQHYVLKLWFAKPPGRMGERVLLHLLRQGAPADHDVGILFVRDGAVTHGGQAIPQPDAYLGSEADAFLGAWRRLR